MPKSSSLTASPAPTSTFAGFRSRCTISWRCAAATAATTSSQSDTRASSGRRRVSQCASIGSPSTYSSASHGTPSARTPPSSSRAMRGSSRRARICRSCSKRATSSGVARPDHRHLIAARCWNAPSARSASSTRAMPPCASVASARHAPKRWPAAGSSASAAQTSASSAAASASSPPASAAASMPRSAAARSGRVAASSRRNPARASPSRSSARRSSVSSSSKRRGFQPAFMAPAVRPARRARA